MLKDFFEISLDKLPVSNNLENKKYTAEQYQKMGESLGKIQNSMDQGQTGKEILANDRGNDLYGVGESYKNFYNPQSSEKVKIDFDSKGNITSNPNEITGYTNGRHRIEAARQQGINYIPAEISAPNFETLQKLKSDHGSHRDLSKFNPQKEAKELDREKYFNIVASSESKKNNQLPENRNINENKNNFVNQKNPLKERSSFNNSELANQVKQNDTSDESKLNYQPQENIQKNNKMSKSKGDSVNQKLSSENASHNTELAKQLKESHRPSESKSNHSPKEHSEVNI